MADAAAGVLVGDVDELADGVLAVAGDAGRDALGDRGDLAADHQAAIVVAGDVGLDDEVAGAALGAGERVRPRIAVLRAEVELDAAAVVAVERLDDAGVAEAVRRRGGLVLGLDDRAPRHRQAGRVEESVREALVRRDVDADAARVGGHRGPDPLLVDALAELDERVAVEADVGDVAAGRLVEDRQGAGPEGLALGQPDQTLELGHEVDRDRRVAGRDKVVDEGDGDLAGLGADRLLAELVDHVVAAALAGAAGLAVADVRAGEVLQLEGDVLGDVAGPGPLPQPRDEAAAAAEGAGVVLEAREELDEGFGEARHRVGGELLEDAEVDNHSDDRLPGPIVGAAEDARLDDAEGGLGPVAVGLGVDGAAATRGRGRRGRRGGRGVLRRRRLRRARFRCRLRHGALPAEFVVARRPSRPCRGRAPSVPAARSPSPFPGLSAHIAAWFVAQRTSNERTRPDLAGLSRRRRWHTMKEMSEDAVLGDLRRLLRRRFTRHRPPGTRHKMSRC